MNITERTFSLEDRVTILTEYVGLSSETVRCVTGINGYNSDTLEDILYWATGYNSFAEFVNCETLDW